MSNEPITNRVPPQNIDAEKAVLGAIFLSTDALPEAMVKLHAEDFYKRSHQIIFKGMESLSDDDQPIDLITLTNYLKEHKLLEDAGGVQYLTELSQFTPTAANITYYAQIVHNKYLARKLINTATKIATDGYDGNESVNDMIDNAERDILSVGEDQNSTDFKDISEVLKQSFDKINELSQDKGNRVTGLSTGYKALDDITTGLHPGELTIVAARPAVGKTAFALNVAQNVATMSKKTVAIFSLEMGAESLVNRMICAEGSIDANHLRTGQLNNEEWQNLIIAMGSLSKTSVYIDDTPGNRMAEIRAKSRRLAKNDGNLGLIVVDYLQLIEGGGNIESRQQEVSMISRQLKKLAKELNVPVIALSQLSRSVEQRQDKRPVLSDIRESGSIEQDADIVAFLYREDYYEHGNNDDDDDDNDNQVDANINNDVGEVEVIIEKNRSGPRGTVKLIFVKSHNKFTSISYADPDE